MGERLLCKQEVIGSIPFTSTTRRRRVVCRRALGRAKHRARSWKYSLPFGLALDGWFFDRVKRE